MVRNVQREGVMEGWQWWLLGVAVFVWAMDVHRRVSQAGDAIKRIEARLDGDLTPPPNDPA